MPRVPVRQSKESEILAELKEQSNLYSRKATLLSNLLEKAEQFFREMPAKTMIRTESKNPLYDLSLDKVGGSWRLVLLCFENDPFSAVPVTQASILQKAAAATLLPELYERLKETFTYGQLEIDRGLKSLESLPFLDFSEFDTPNNHSKYEGDSDGPF